MKPYGFSHFGELLRQSGVQGHQSAAGFWRAWYYFRDSPGLLVDAAEHALDVIRCTSLTRCQSMVEVTDRYVVDALLVRLIALTWRLPAIRTYGWVLALSLIHI